MANSLRRSAILRVKEKNVAFSTSAICLNSTAKPEKHILKSVYKDIPPINYTVNDFVWHNLDRWPDKTATVS